MQRDWGVDGGLRTAAHDDVARLRERAVAAVQAVYRHLGLADLSDDWAAQAVDAAGSKDVVDGDLMAPLVASRIITETGVTMVDVVGALYETGFDTEAQRLLDMLGARRRGDHLQTAAIFDEQMNVLSLVTDPNDYAGPGTGYQPTPRRAAELDTVRQQRSVADLRATQRPGADGTLLRALGPAAVSSDPRDVVIGVSPAVGRDIWTTLSGLPVVDVLRELLAGLEEEGCVGRVVRVDDTIDLGLIGLTAARLAGSGIAIGLQGKGTALIHRRDLSPLMNLELYSVAPVVDAPLYRLLGSNAGRHAKGATPEPARNPYTDEAIEARYHMKVVALVAIERACMTASLPTQLEAPHV
jgi:propanediol dehydratase large subunit